MKVENVIVRRKRASVERFGQRERWNELTDADYAQAADDLAPLPTDLPPEDESVRRFDLLVLRTQLALAEHLRSFPRLKEQAQAIAGKLAEKRAIPMVAAQMELILDLTHDEWWENATLPMLERVRKKLRDLVQFIDKSSRPIIYTNFEDTLSGATEVPLAGIAEAVDARQYRERMLAFLKAHENHIAVRKVRMGEALTSTDLDELDRLLFVTSGLGDRATFERAYGQLPRESLGSFIRSLVGMDREAAKKAFGEFLADANLTAEQIRFVNTLIDELTRSGVVPVERLYESPYTDANPAGLDGVFEAPLAGRLLKILDAIGPAADWKQSSPPHQRAGS